MKVDGIEYFNETIHGLEVRFTEITTRAMARHLGRPVGTYAAIHTGRLKDLGDWRPAANCLAECLGRLWAPWQGGRLLIAGLGDEGCIHNCLGPRVVRHIPRIAAFDTPCVFRSVSRLVPGTREQTDTSIGTVLSGMVQAVEANCVLLIDTESTAQLEDVAAGVELSTGGLSSSGGGEILSPEILDVPILAICVPLLLHIPPKTVNMLHLHVDREGVVLMDTHIGKEVQTAATVISRGIVQALYPERDLERLQGPVSPYPAGPDGGSFRPLA